MPETRSTPKFKVKVDGRDLPAAVASALREIQVDRGVNTADMFVLSFDNARCRFSDDESLHPGKKVEIELGYEEGGGQTKPVMDGEITAIKAIFPRRGPATVKVQGYTKYHRLQRGRQTRSFTDVTYSAIAERIAQEVGLEPVVDPSQPVWEMVFQRNQSNLEFLYELAARIAYEVFVSDGKLYFRKPRGHEAKVATFTKGRELLSFNPRLRVYRLPSSAKAAAFDTYRNEPVRGEAQESHAQPKTGASEQAFQVGGQLGVPTAVQAVHRLRLRDASEGVVVAQSVLREAAMQTIDATATLQGTPDLKPGTVIELREVGEIFSGVYYVTRVVHNYLSTGFATIVDLKCALDAAPPPPPPPPPPPAPAPGGGGSPGQTPGGGSPGGGAPGQTPGGGSPGQTPGGGAPGQTPGGGSPGQTPGGGAPSQTPGGGSPGGTPEQTPAEPAEDNRELNPYVLQVISQMPTGTGYEWPSSDPSVCGTTRDLFYSDGYRVAKAGAPSQTYCCGVTFEVFFRAYEAYCQAKGKPFKIGSLTRGSDVVSRIRSPWYVATGGRGGPVDAIPPNGIGMSIASPSQAKPGDFCQGWRSSGSGHSFIFLGMEGSSIRYWSSQSSTNGCGERTESFSQVYIARCVVPE